MAILINKDTRVLIQGITGSEGSRACKEMLSYGTKVVAGVTPGKGGQEVAAQFNGEEKRVPVYNSVKEALEKHPDINASLIAVPAKFIRGAAQEVIVSRIPLINILADHVTVEDCALIYALAKKAGVQVIGPSSIGIISPAEGVKLGAIGSGETKDVFTPGPVGIISKSGGMTAEISSVLSRAGMGQSTVIGIGGDQIIGSDFADILKLFKDDVETKVVVIFGEVGGSYEEQMADYIITEKFNKPVIAVIAGAFSEKLPKETVLGHAGAIVSGGKGSYKSKIESLTKAGVYLPKTLEEIPTISRQLKVVKV